MKRSKARIAKFIVFITMLLAMTLAYSVYASAAVPGDVNGDGSVDVRDAATILLYVYNKPVELVNEVADSNGDGVIDIMDSSHLLKYITGHQGIELSVGDNCKHELTKIDSIRVTCTSAGRLEHWSCSKCSKLFKDDKGIMLLSEAATIIPQLGDRHTEVIDVAVAPTCTATGLTEGKHCSVCDTVIVAQTVVPAKGHTEVIDAAVAPTCTATGLTEGKHCTVCNTVTVAQTTVPAKGHTEVIDAAVAPTCTATGLTEGKHCTVCNTVTVAQTTVPAKGHTEVIDAAVAPTCTETGLTEGKHCSVCNTVIVAQELVPIIDHIEGEWIVDEAATKTEDGSKHTECTKCRIVMQTQIIPATGSLGLEFTLNSDKASYSVKRGTCTDAEIVIPSVYNGKPVTSIADEAFSYSGLLTRITIPNSVTSIGMYAFQYCNRLTSITIPDSVTSIENFALLGCKSLTSVTIHNGVTIIGNRMFAGCTSLTSVTIPDSVTTIGDVAFGGCTSLASITIPHSVTSIGSQAFSNCTSLTSITIPNSIKSIGDYTFNGCTSLISITIPDSIKSIGNLAFSNCISLTSITIPNSVKSIGISAFSDCTSLKNVYYSGAETEWNAIDIHSTNAKFINIKRYYYSETAPTVEGDFWHYVDGVPTVWETQTQITDPTIIVSSATVSAGATDVEITIALKNNPGITSALMKVAFDNTNLTLTGVTYNTSIGGQNIPPQSKNSPVTIYWTDGFNNVTGDWTLVTLTYTVSSSAPKGDYDISVTYNPDDLYNADETNVDFDVINGKITVS